MGVSTELKFDYSGLIAAALRPALEKAVQDAAERVVSVAGTIVPVRTGALKAGITWEKTGEMEATVHTSEPGNYAPFVEFGTSRQAPQPFMTPAAEQERPRFEASIGAILNKVP